jgi:pimeloyl-ACP methyl ester carboxylesterase
MSEYTAFSSPPRCLVSALALLLLLGLLAGCATPVGVTRVSSRTSYRDSTANPLNQRELSNSAKVVLHRYNLAETFVNDPQKVIRFLQETAILDDRRDLIFALAELSYLWGDHLLRSSSWDDLKRAPDSFLLAAIYAYFYLLGDGKEPPPTPYDNRFREACDLYNRALWQAFPADEEGALDLSGGVRTLPVGSLTITLKPETLNWSLDKFEKFLPADAFLVHGFSVRNRTPGLGLPLIGVTSESKDNAKGGSLPVTAFLRINGGIRKFGSGSDSATLELYSAYDDTEVKVNGRSVPLETDSTAPLAYRLNDASVWSLGLKQFISGGKITNQMLLIQPYEEGRIPVVFVHGTASSPVWWAEMLNSLRSDPTIRKRYQFWFYQYNSSNMVMLSAANLRDTLSGMVKKLDPQGHDPALRQMVVIGHSQGGLLTKMTAITPGDRLWKSISDKDLEKLDIDDDLKEMGRRMFFFDQLPFVKRVVFISTPHRGSYLTKEWVRNLVRRLVSLPYDLLTFDPELYIKVVNQLKLPASMRGIPTSIDSMSEDNPNLQTLATLPLAPGVTGHSIIAVLPDMDIKTGNDGVVEYRSAHIDGVKSEFIVRSEHSSQGHPFTIEEVRRILMEHIGVEVIGPEVVQVRQPPVNPHPPAALPAAPPATEAPAAAVGK